MKCLRLGRRGDCKKRVRFPLIVDHFEFVKFKKSTKGPVAWIAVWFFPWSGCVRVSTDAGKPNLLFGLLCIYASDLE